MSLHKAIAHGKEKRRPFSIGSRKGITGIPEGKVSAKDVSASCNNNGGCEYCRSNRLHSDKKNRQAANEQLNELKFEKPYDLQNN